MTDLNRWMEQINRVIAQGPYTDSWDSLFPHPAPRWFRDAKFGIFIHWGVYSVPAFGSEWYSRNMYVQGSREFQHHIETYGPHKDFGYKDFIPLFRAERFDAEAWASLFEEAGAKYVVPVAEHHDGFQMYRSELSHWNAYEMGPQRDTLGELCGAFQQHGLVPCASSHRAEHWFFMGHGKEFDSDIHEPLHRGDFYWPSMPEPPHQDLLSQPYPSEEYLQDWLARCCEIIDRYRPGELYFDWWIHHEAFKPWLKKLAAYYYNRAAEWGQEVLIAYKHDAFAFGTAVVDIERGQFADVQPYAWQTCAAVALNSWGYTDNNQYRAPADIVCDLVDIVSKNGNLLLNVGPRADGTIPDEDAAILRAIGAWLAVNGESIYGTRPWRVFGEGPTQVEEGQFTDFKKKEFTPQDVRYTAKGEHIYATALRCAPDGRYCFPALGLHDAARKPLFHGIITDVDLLGYPGCCQWQATEGGLQIQTAGVMSDMPLVFRVRVE